MSWDLYLECATCGQSIDLGNYTHNTNPMIRAASIIPEPSPSEQPSIAGEVLLHEPTFGECWEEQTGKTGFEVAEFAGRIRHELESRPEYFDAMNPPNGWGSRKSLVDFLWSIERQCRENPTLRFRASG